MKKEDFENIEILDGVPKDYYNLGYDVGYLKGKREISSVCFVMFFVLIVLDVFEVLLG